MSKLRRIMTFLGGLITLLTGVIIIVFPDLGYYLILAILTFSLLISGLGKIIYYFRMAIFMVGGKRILYEGVILFDIGFLGLTLNDVPIIYIIIYLMIIHVISGIIDILQSFESKKLGSRHWRLKTALGIMNILIAIACIALIRIPNTAVIIYGLGLIITAFIRIANSVRRTAFVYVM